MKLGYINQTASATELIQQIEQQKAKGVDIENIALSTPFSEFINNVPCGCTVVIPSYGTVFNNLYQMIDTLLTLHKKGVYVESATEPMVCSPEENIDLLERIRHISPSLNKTRVSSNPKGKRGRPPGSIKASNNAAEVDKIRKKLNISIEKACRIVGCQPRTYYRNKKAQDI